MTKYIGMTLGPIGDTMQMTSSPAGMWAASNLFSWIAKELIEQLVRAGIDPNRFISPAFFWDETRDCLTLDDGSSSEQCCEPMRKKGVGMLHDRIIFEGDDLGTVRRAIDAALETLAAGLGEIDSERFPEQELKQWLAQYLHLYAAKAEVDDGQNPILVLGERLDSLEQEPGYVPAQKIDCLHVLFEGKDAGENRNAQVHRSFLVRETEDWMLLDETDGVKQLDDIARSMGETPVRHKHQQYYAVLQADGDNMGAVLKRLAGQGNDKIRSFSRHCMQYCARTAQLVLDYGGIPIYAGGDDLLALIPLVHRSGKETFFHLVEGISAAFREIFSEEIEAAKKTADPDAQPVVPSVSFGMAIQYVKSPLYEALGRAGTQLFGCAKQMPGKNALSLDLQKHSGQSVCIRTAKIDGAESLKKLNEMMAALMEQKDGAETKAGLFLTGAGYHIEAFETLFEHALRAENPDVIDHLFDNVFDNAGQAKFGAYLGELKQLTRLLAEEEPDAEPKAVIRRLQAMIRLLHFMLEGKEEEA